MIHLDRNPHSAASPLDKQNLLLSDDKILSWSSISHDDQSFSEDFGSLQQQGDVTSTTTSPTPLPPASTTSTSSTHPGPVTPIDAADPPRSHSSPASPADGNSTSPTRDRSSSLSPAPDSASPNTHLENHSSPLQPAGTEEKEAPVEAPRKEEEEEEEVKTADKMSRVSTPLSELSPPPPDQEDETETNGGDESQKDNASDASTKPKEGTSRPNGTGIAINDASGSNPAADSASSTPIPFNLASKSSSAGNVGIGASPAGFHQQSPTIESPLTPSSINASNSAASGNDPKVVTMLELNLELIKVIMGFQSRGINSSDPKYKEYRDRLQSNLAWLAGSVDQTNQHNQHNVTLALPTITAPPPVDFMSIDRIRQIYAELPTLLAKEIARKQQMGSLQQQQQQASQQIQQQGSQQTQQQPQGQGHPHGPGQMPSQPNLKRDRPDERAGPDQMNKRRDTGENKVPTPSLTGTPGPAQASMMPPPSSIPISNNAGNSNFGMNGVPVGANPVNTVGMNQASSAQGGENTATAAAAMGGAGMMAGMINPSEAQMAAVARERARQAQIGAARAAAASSAQNPMAAQAAAGRGPGAMGPPGGMGGPGMSGNMSSMNPPAGPSGMGGAGSPGGSGGPGGNGMPTFSQTQMQQAYQALQNPNNSFVNYLARNIPGFLQMPPNIQVQRMLMAQYQLKQQQENQNSQNSMMGQQQRNQMGNAQQLGPMGMQGSGMGGGMGGNMNAGMGAGMGSGMGSSMGGGMGSGMGPGMSGNISSGMGGNMGGNMGGGMGGNMGSSMAGGMGGAMGMGGNMSAGFPGQASNPASPAQQSPQNQMFAGQGGGAIDPRVMAAAGGQAAGMNMNNLTPQQQQRQLMLMQQQRGGGGGGGGGPGGMGGMNPMIMNSQMNPQQMAFAQQQQQQERMRHAQERLQAQQQQAMASPTHPSSPMPGDNFPALRSNSAIPGIARSTRSPSESAPSPMTPRAPTRGPSLGQDDYNRMMIQQQQNQAARVLQSQGPSPGGFAHPMGGSGNWQNQQQQQAMQMGGGGQGGNYAMSPPGGAGNSYGGAPSPPNSATQNNWGTASGYPFGGSPGGDQLRRMSGTPGPQQQHQQIPLQNASSPADQQPMSNDFDLFNNWGT